MRVVAGIIGGTGIGERLLALGGNPVHIPTAFGMVRGRRVEVEGHPVLVMSRHSAGHKVPPHKVNYRGMALALRAVGARFCLSTAAVGSLREDWTSGTLAICSDFLDLTARNVTLFDREVVHTDFSEPFGPVCRQALIEGAKVCGMHVERQGVYINGNGPRYETPYEVAMYRRLGADVVGMTAASEAIAMREAGIDYGCISAVTNMACGIVTSPLTHEEVVAEMNRIGKRTVRLLTQAVVFLAARA